MNIEDVRQYALGLKGATEDLFDGGKFLSFRIGGKWFMLMPLDAAEARIAVKLRPEHGACLREEHDGVRPAYHMNKKHWNDLYINRLADSMVCRLIEESYQLVRSGLTKNVRKRLED